MKLSRLLATLGGAVLLTACASSRVTVEPAPLPEVVNKLALEKKWHQSLDSADYIRLQPALSARLVAAISESDQLSLFDVKTGKILWEVALPHPAVGTVALGENSVVAATLKGDVLAFDVQGKQLWRRNLGVQISAQPVIAGEVVLVRGNDGRLTALSSQDGALKWNYTRQQPLLVLSNYAAPLVEGQRVFYGQTGGRLAAISLSDGRLLWETQVAQPRGSSEIERITDVVSTPVVSVDMVCAAAFQGRVACFNQKDGGLIWARESSSWAGIAADEQALYVSDEKGVLSAYAVGSGRLLWNQDKLLHRRISGLVVMGKTLLLGDFKGYLHFIDTENGNFVAQLATDGGAIVAPPQEVNGHWLVQTQKGGLYLLAPK